MEYKRCSVCVMDNASDSTITFDDNGQCNYCKGALSQIGTTAYFPNEEGKIRLEALINKIKEEGKGKEFDCLMGISGGLDSAYLAYLGHIWGLRILAVHIDDGFDTEISRGNIAKLVKAADIKMMTIKPDEKQFNDLTKAFMLAGVPDIAIPQDNVLFAFLYDVAKEYKMKYFLSGGNFALECVLQNGNMHSAYDTVNIKAINKRFGTQPTDKLKFISSVQKEFNKRFLGLNTVCPLDYLDYNRDRAYAELKKFCGFEYYGGKHLENYLTAFTQLCWLPEKFNFDKRTSHLSSMIVSGQMTRASAIKELETKCDAATLKKIIDTVKTKLNFSDDEFDKMMAAPTKHHEDYKTGKLAPVLFALRKKILGR